MQRGSVEFQREICILMRRSRDSEAGAGVGARRPEDRVSRAVVDQQSERYVGLSNVDADLRRVTQRQLGETHLELRLVSDHRWK